MTDWTWQLVYKFLYQCKALECSESECGLRVRYRASLSALESVLGQQGMQSILSGSSKKPPVRFVLCSEHPTTQGDLAARMMASCNRVGRVLLPSAHRITPLPRPQGLELVCGLVVQERQPVFPAHTDPPAWPCMPWGSAHNTEIASRHRLAANR